MRKQLARLQPAARQDPHRRRRRSWRSRCRSRTRRVQVPAQVPAGRPVRPDRGYQSFVVGNTGRRGERTTTCSPGATRAAARQPRQVLSGEARHGQRRALAHPGGRSRPPRRARRPAGFGGRDRREDRRGARDVLEPDLRPEPARGHDTEVVQATFSAQRRPRQARAAARVPRALPAGLDVQGRDQRAAIDSRLGITPTTPCTRSSARSRSRAPTADAANFGGEVVRRQPHREPRRTRATPRSATRPRARQRVRAGDATSAVSASDRRRSTSRPARSAASVRRRLVPERPAAVRQAASARDVVVTPLQMALVAAGIANGGVIMEPHVVNEIQNADGSGADDRPEAVEDVHVAQHARRAHRHDGRGRERGHRNRGADPGRRRRRQDRNRADRRRARPRTRGSSRSRRPRTRGTRWR